MAKEYSTPQESFSTVVAGGGKVREQAMTSEALAARGYVDAGGELSRVVSRDDQIWDGAQSWSLTPAAEICSAPEFNAANGVPDVVEGTTPLSPPGVITGRMGEGAPYVTTYALDGYWSDKSLPTLEVVAPPDTVVTTGYRDLSPPPTLSDVFPSELKSSPTLEIQEESPPLNETGESITASPFGDPLHESTFDTPSTATETTAPASADTGPSGADAGPAGVGGGGSDSDGPDGGG